MIARLSLPASSDAQRDVSMLGGAILGIAITGCMAYWADVWGTGGNIGGPTNQGR